MQELVLGAMIGFGAGLSPGPLLALVVTNTLKRGFGGGVRVALAPLVTDAPIIFVTVIAIDAVPRPVLRVFAAAGGLYLIALGAVTASQARSTVLTEAPTAPGRGDLWQGVITNALSPHPWLFWVAAGGPLFVDAWDRAPPRGAAFLAGFYGLLVGSKAAVAAAVAQGRRRLTERWYRRALVAAGALLAVAGTALLWDAVARGAD